MPLRVLVVEDSIVQRAHLRRVIEAGGDLRVVAETASADEALEAIGSARPHVATIDLAIPGSGLRVIREIMLRRPMPILVISAALGGVAATEAVEALASGAADVLPKPARWTAAAEEDVRARLRALARRWSRPPVAVSGRAGVVVALAASTGGPAALAQVLTGMGRIDAGVLVVQHLHEDFGEAFLAWMARSSPLPVRAAVHGEPLRPGQVTVAAGRSHLQLGARRRVVLRPVTDGSLHPSADLLFSSVAAEAGSRAVGVVLTGMGQDGARGLLSMRRAGAVTIAQDQASSAVFGMPRAALELKAADTALPLTEIGPAVRRAVERIEARA